MRIKDLNSRVKGAKIHLKLYPGAKANQLNHYIKPTLEEYKYDCTIIHVGINDILRNENDTDLNNLPESILEIANTCQNYNIGKIFISALLPSKRTKANISQINETLKQLCSRNNFIFVEHENIGFDDLWVDGIHLLNSGKAVLGSNFVSEVNRYFGKSDNFLGNFDINLDISFRNNLKHKGINTRVDTPISELTVFHRSATENDINDAKKALRKSKFSHLIN